MLLFLAAAIFAAGQNIFQVGEILTYRVSYLGITLGEITVETKEQLKFKGKSVYDITGEIKSASGIPFASIHQILSSKVHKSAKYTMQATAKMKEGDKWNYDTLFCHYDDKKLNFVSWRGGKKVKSEEFDINKTMSDGVSLFFLARTYLDSKYNISIPTFMGVDTASTRLYFTGKTENIEIDAVEKPIKTKYFHGSADWEGPYGLQGDFEGWFSDDDAHVPITANVKVILGDVSIELISWTRKNWRPPTE